MAATESCGQQAECAAALRWASQPVRAMVEQAAVAPFLRVAQALQQTEKPSGQEQRLVQRPEPSGQPPPSGSQNRPGPQAVRRKQRSLASPSPHPVGDHLDGCEPPRAPSAFPKTGQRPVRRRPPYPHTRLRPCVQQPGVPQRAVARLLTVPQPRGLRRSQAGLRSWCQPRWWSVSSSWWPQDTGHSNPSQRRRIAHRKTPRAHFATPPRTPIMTLCPHLDRHLRQPPTQQARRLSRWSQVLPSPTNHQRAQEASRSHFGPPTSSSCASAPPTTRGSSSSRST